MVIFEVVKSTEWRFVLWNADIPNDETPIKSNLSNDWQYMKANDFIIYDFDSVVKDVSDVQFWKQSSSIAVKNEPHSTFFNLIQLSKPPILVIADNFGIFSKSKQYLKLLILFKFGTSPVKLTRLKFQSMFFFKKKSS